MLRISFKVAKSGKQSRGGVPPNHSQAGQWKTTQNRTPAGFHISSAVYNSSHLAWPFHILSVAAWAPGHLAAWPSSRATIIVTLRARFFMPRCFRVCTYKCAFEDDNGKAPKQRCNWFRFGKAAGRGIHMLRVHLLIWELFMFGLTVTSSHIAYNLRVTAAEAARPSNIPIEFRKHPPRIQSNSSGAITAAADLAYTFIHTQEEHLCPVFPLFSTCDAPGISSQPQSERELCTGAPNVSPQKNDPKILKQLQIAK